MEGKFGVAMMPFRGCFAWKFLGALYLADRKWGREGDKIWQLADTRAALRLIDDELFDCQL